MPADFNGGPGNDTFTGDSTDETIFGFGGEDSFDGGGGDDLINGGADGDVLYGGDGDDTLDYTGSLLGVTIDANGGASGGDAEGDVVDNFENILGSAAGDLLFADSLETGSTIGDTNRVDGAGGNDTIVGSNGVLAIGETTLELEGGAGNDTLTLARGDIQIDTFGKINVRGGADDDEITLVDRSATVTALGFGLGDEIVLDTGNGTSNTVILAGDIGAPTSSPADLTVNGIDISVAGGTGADTLILTTPGGTLSADDATLAFVGGGGADTLSGTSTSQITLNNFATLSAEGGDGADHLFIAGEVVLNDGVLTIDGGAQDDVINLGDSLRAQTFGDAHATGGTGNDIVLFNGDGGAGVIDGSGFFTLQGGEGDDTVGLYGLVRVVGSDVRVGGEQGNDVLYGGTTLYIDTATVNLSGGEGNDTLIASSAGTSDEINGTVSGLDIVFGGFLDLFGGTGNDTLIGVREIQPSSGPPVAASATITNSDFSNFGLRGGADDDTLILSEVDVTLTSSGGPAPRGFTYLYGQGGNDTIIGSQSDLTIIDGELTLGGGIGDDTIIGAVGTLTANDAFISLGNYGTGHDSITVAGSIDLVNTSLDIFGGIESDLRITTGNISLSSNSAIAINGGYKADTVIVGAANTTITGLTPFQTVFVEGGGNNVPAPDDLLILQDELAQGETDNTFAIEGAMVSLSGGFGEDEIRLASSGGRVILDSAILEADGGDGDDFINSSGPGSTFELKNFGELSVFGGYGNDVVSIGNLIVDGVAEIQGGSGNDQISAGGSSTSISDTFFSSLVLTGGYGNDGVALGTGKSLTLSGSGEFQVRGDSGNDTVSMQGDVSLTGLSGTLSGGTGNDTILGSTGLTANDAMLMFAGNDGIDEITIGHLTGLIVDGGTPSFSDTITGLYLNGRSDVYVDGGSGNDTISGLGLVYTSITGLASETSGTADAIAGAPKAAGTFSDLTGTLDIEGNLSLDGQRGNDTVILSEFDAVFVGGGEIVLEGGGGNDTIVGIQGDTALDGNRIRLDGEDGNDTIELATGTVKPNSGSFVDLFGGDGNDTIIASAAEENINGGSGSDTVDYGSSEDGVTVFLDFNAFPGFSTGGDAEGDILNGIEVLIGSAFDDVVFGQVVNDTLIGAQGRDFLSGGAGVDFIYGGEDADVLEPGAGKDFVDGGEGQDLLSASDATSRVTIDLFDMSASSADYADDVLISIEGVLGTNAFSNTLRGSNDADLLIGGAEADTLVARDGADILLGQAGDDLIVGGIGNDIFLTGLGNDTVITNQDEDIILFALNNAVGEGNDQINDFEIGADLIIFYGTGFATEDVLVSTALGTTNALLSYGTSSVELIGVTEAEVNANTVFLEV